MSRLANVDAMPRVVIRQLSKSFAASKAAPIPALRDFSLTIEGGELLTLVGPSGSGKTTLLRLIAGLDNPDNGTIELEGQDITRIPPEKRDVAMVFQNLALYPHLTVAENLGLGLKLRGVARAEIDSKIHEATALLDLAPLLGRHPATLSGGQAQRVALGRALVRQPKLFLLDEPLSNLDAPTRQQLRQEIVALQRKLRVPMIYVTHDQAEAMSMGQRVVVLHEGGLQQVAPPMELYDHPANRFVATFIGSPTMNLIRGRLVAENGQTVFRETGANGETLADGWSLPFDAGSGIKPVDGLMQLGVRPEAFAIAGSTGNSTDATVTGIEPLGFETHIHLRSAAHELTARAGARVSVAVGDRVGLNVDLTRVNLFDATTGNRMDQR